MKRAAVTVLLVLGLAAFLGRGLVVEKLTLKRGAEAYLIGYPLVTMTATRAALVVPPAQMNAFSHLRYLPDGQSAVNVVSPSRDLVYSSAWLDLTAGPVLVEQPDMGDRFWLMPVLDAWTNVIADPGTRTMGNGAHRYIIAGPDWNGATPADAQLYRSPTNLAWALLRIEALDGLRGAARLQNGWRIAPLANPTEYTKPAVYLEPDSPVDVRAQVDGLGAEQFFDRLRRALASTPLVPDDPDAQEAVDRILSMSEPSAAQRRGLDDVPGRVQQGMTEAVESGEAGTISNGWRIPPMILGDYGTEYPVRAVIAREGLGANLPEDAVYASTSVDSAGQQLQGGRTYSISVPADLPVRAFWSITVYDNRGNLLPGPARGLSVSGTGRATRITVSPEKVPGPWLRAPVDGGFRLLMRLYWPEQSVLDNRWEYPVVSAG